MNLAAVRKKIAVRAYISYRQRCENFAKEALMAIKSGKKAGQDACMDLVIALVDLINLVSDKGTDAECSECILEADRAWRNFAEKCGGCLSGGDSPTALWLRQAVVQIAVNSDPDIYNPERLQANITALGWKGTLDDYADPKITSPQYGLLHYLPSYFGMTDEEDTLEPAQ